MDKKMETTIVYVDAHQTCIPLTCKKHVVCNNSFLEIYYNKMFKEVKEDRRN